MKVFNKFSQLTCRVVLGSIFVVVTFFVMTNTVLANPVLDVSVSPGLVLLGGQAFYTVTVTNTDQNDKGYNLSFESVFSSNPGSNRSVTFHSASDSHGDLTPNSVTTDSNNGDTTIDLLNIKDLAPNEAYTFTLVVDMSGDTTWNAMDDLIHNITATVNTMPDGSGSDVADVASDTSDVLPIALVEKVVNQSTGVEQATGTTDRPYSYQINVQNNYTNTTDNVVVTDTLPDGIEFLGITSGHNCSNSRDNATGVTTIVCSLGTMAPGALEEIKYDAGIRYDYFGTDNGGTNRIHDDFDGTPATGTPIPDKTVLTNHVDLDAEYQGDTVPTQSDDVSVTAAYATVSKSSSISNGGNGDTVNYTLTYTTSEYYDILDDNLNNDTSSITLHDHLPDGQTFVNNSATPTQTSLTTNGDGTTDIYWNSSVLNGLAHSSSFDVTFSATIDNTWNDGTPVVAADRMTNTVDSHGQWDDQVDTGRANGITNSSASASFGMETPPITKEVEDPNNPGTWVDAADAVVGDTMRFRVRFNTNDGVNPVVSNVNLGDIVVTDWLPPGMSLVPGSVTETYSAGGDFTDGGDPDTESVVTIGSLNGVEWNLGDIAQGGWWQAIFEAKVNDIATVTDGAEVNNIWKMTGVNSFGNAYSDRDTVAITYREPHLVLHKNISNHSNPVKPGDNIEYTITITNDGHATAKDISFKDIVSTYADDTTPTVTSVDLNGTALVEGSGYVAPTWNAGNREFIIDFNDGGVETNIPVGQTLTIVYQTTVNSDVGSGTWLGNTATVSYNSQDDGSGRIITGTTNTADANTDNAGISTPNLIINKTVPAGPYTVGDTIPYTLEVTVPQGQIAYWPDIQDTFNKDGVSYIPGSTVLTNISGSPVTGASFDSSTNSDPVITTSGSDNTQLLWNFNNPIDNRGQASDYVFRLTYNVIYTGLEDNGTDWEFFQPTNNDQVNNIATINWNNIPAGSRTTNRNTNDNVTIDIDQPILSTNKTVVSSGPYGSGSTIDYQVVITNTGQATAYDITWEDILPTGTGNATLTSVNHSNLGILTSGTGFLENFTGNPLLIDFDGGSTDTNLAPGETITILYSITINNDGGAGSQFTNTEDVDWSNKDGNVNGERVYNDSNPENAYTVDTDTAVVTVASPTINKVSSVAEATIGQEFDYIITVDIPTNTTTYNAEVRDLVPDGLTVIGTNTTPNIGSITATENLNGTTPVIWSVGDISNPGTSQLVLTIHVRVDDAFNNANLLDGLPVGIDGDGQDVLTNNGEFYWDTADTGGTTQNLNDNTNVTIAEPHPTITKTVNDHTAGIGDVMHYTITITNDGTSPLYNIHWQDTLPNALFNAGVSPTLTSVTHSTNGLLSEGTNYNSNFNVNPILIDFNSNPETSLAPGESLTIVYDATVDNTVHAGDILINDTDFTSNSESLADNGDSNARSYNGEANQSITIATTSIGDKVWIDENVNGIQDVGEEGLAGITVHLLDGSGNPVDNPMQPGTPYIVQTDTNGNYLFANLTAGNYQVHFDYNGYVLSPQNQGGDDTLDSDVDINTGTTTSFALAHDEHITNIDAGMYQLTSIGDKIWRDDQRDGIQQDWEPGLEGVVVELLDGSGNPVDDPANPGTPYTITTGSDGNYLFENLLPGDYQVRFTPPADHNPTDKNQGGDITKDSDININTLTTDVVHLHSGENNTSIDAGFYALYANVFDPPHAIKTVGETGENEVEWTMVWINDGNMTAIAIQILDDVPVGTTYVANSFTCEARGASVTSVCTYDMAENRVRWEGDIAPDPGGTDENNSLNEVVLRYRTTVPSGMKTVENQASAHWDANGDGDFNDDIARGQEPVVTDNDTIDGNDYTVWTRREEAKGNSSIGNYIWLDKNGDGKQDEDEKGLEDIRVKLIWYGPNGKYDHGKKDDKVWRTDTNHNGHYKFENLPKGKYKVIVKEEDVAKYVQTYDPDKKMDGRDNVKLRKNQNYTKADFGYNDTETTLAKTGENWWEVIWETVKAKF